MQRLREFQRSSRNLIVFEAAARLGSFTLAAQELGMQQPSVSAAIRQLEEALGVQLFLRAHRQVTLTREGNQLFNGISGPMTDVEAALNALRQQGQLDHVTLSTSSAFSFYWMMPRLGNFRETHPGIDLRVQNSDRDPDLDAENISLGIRLGNGKWPGLNAAKIADEIIYPIASPRMMAAAVNLRSVPSLLHQRLIHLEEPIRKRPTWSDWFESFDIKGADITRGLQLNDYALVLQAAISGDGFAFGWNHIVRDLVAAGTIAAKQDWEWKTGNGIYVVWSDRQNLSERARKVRDWIISVSDFPT